MKTYTVDERQMLLKALDLLAEKVSEDYSKASDGLKFCFPLDVMEVLKKRMEDINALKIKVRGESEVSQS